MDAPPPTRYIPLPINRRTRHGSNPLDPHRPALRGGHVRLRAHLRRLGTRRHSRPRLWPSGLCRRAGPEYHPRVQGRSRALPKARPQSPTARRAPATRQGKAPARHAGRRQKARLDRDDLRARLRHHCRRGPAAGGGPLRHSGTRRVLGGHLRGFPRSRRRHCRWLDRVALRADVSPRQRGFPPAQRRPAPRSNG